MNTIYLIPNPPLTKRIKRENLLMADWRILKDNGGRDVRWGNEGYEDDYPFG
jgi:hypothetical protein